MSVQNHLKSHGRPDSILHLILFSVKETSLKFFRNRIAAWKQNS